MNLERDIAVMLHRWLLVAALILWPTLGQTQELGTPNGQVVLTVAGAIDATNRGPYDESEDVFFKYHERQFDKAVAFDLAMLEGLGVHEITIACDGWPAPIRFAGPWLEDVLAAAGAHGKTITVLALDGYASELSTEDLAAYDWMVAVKRDGHYMDIGQRSPLWLVYARRDGAAITADDELRWPWAAFMIEVR
ncbi:MAG: hypothetical protein EXQ94_05055 [Alphaproteobacteria bacterium]|nr:hypothetical protein [Alphaproteobacteria bacterium]